MGEVKGLSKHGSTGLHIFNLHFSESCVFSEPHPSMGGHFLDLFLVPVPQDLKIVTTICHIYCEILTPAGVVFRGTCRTSIVIQL